MGLDNQKEAEKTEKNKDKKDKPETISVEDKLKDSEDKLLRSLAEIGESKT